MTHENTLVQPSIQHNIPISKGGEHELGNISVICRSCNTSIRDKETGELNSREVAEIWDKICELESRGIDWFKNTSLLCQPNDGQVTDTSQPNDSIGKVRLGKSSLGKVSVEDMDGVSDDTPPTQSKKTKTTYAEAVKMTEEEYAKLVEQIGEEGTKWCIDKLNNYKLSKGKRYKEDYRAILSWVIKEYKTQSTKKVNDGTSPSGIRTNADWGAYDG
jgi:hypothetical protein